MQNPMFVFYNLFLLCKESISLWGAAKDGAPFANEND